MGASILTFTVAVDRSGVAHSRVETHDSSFADAYDALLAVRAEVQHQIDSRKNCPAYRMSRECAGCGRIAVGCSSPGCPMVSINQQLKEGT